MSMLDWAKREVEIAIKNTGDYGRGCYESALKCYQNLCKDDHHSGCSIKMTQSILNKLIDRRPLTPIEDTEDVWNRCTRPKDSPIVYQCKRMSSLFKDVYDDGTIKYGDNNRIVCVDIHDENITYFSGLAMEVIDQMFPISMPYMPPEKPFRVYCEEFVTDTKHGDFDTVGIFHALKTVNNEQEKIEISRFFRIEESSWVEISEDEYNERKNNRIVD